MSMRRPSILLALLALVASLLATSPALSIPAPAATVINEFVANHTGSDSAAFVEVLGAASTDLSGLTLLEIEGDSSGPGTIDHAETLGTTDADGYWVSSRDAENGTLTFLLVDGFTGTAGTDLDGNDDGTLDSTPWSSVVDGVAVTDGGTSDRTYGTPVLDASLEGNSGFTPGGASRIPNGTDTDSASDWVRNDFDGAGIPALDPGSPDDGEALNTPAASNVLIGGPSFTINEVDADTSGTDTLEFVELYDGGVGTTPLDGLVLVLFNGSNDSSYEALDLDGLVTSADGYFVIGNAAVTNVDLIVSDNTVQNGADAVALYTADATDFPAGTSVTATGLVDALVYDTDDGDDAGLIDVLTPGQPQVNENGNGLKDTQSNSRCPDGGAALDTTTYTQVQPSPGAPNACGAAPVQPALVSEVQGNGATSPLEGTRVEVSAIVTALFEDDDALQGFFLQEEDIDADGDAATSEGVFVFCGSSCPSTLAVGDAVTVNGEADEFFGMTQINATGATDVTIDSSGNPLPTAVEVTLPASTPTNAEATFEAVEGMVVTFPTTLAVSEYFELARYGQLVLTETSRPYQFTHDNVPSVAGYAAFVDELATRRIILDDNNNDQNDATTGAADEAYPYPSAAWPTGGLSVSSTVRGGDTVSGLTGVMHWSFAGQSGTDAWRIRPIDGLPYTFESTSARTTVPDPVGGDLTVASFNVLNYFESIDLTSSNSSGSCGPSGTMDCRGADSDAELQRQQDKIVAALAAIDADVVGLIEIENSATAVQHLVDGLNAVMGPGTYAQVDTGAIGTDAIKVGFVYKPATVTATGAHAILDSSVDARFVDSKNRPTLIQTFTQNATGEVFTAAVNHLKSKGSDCSDIGEDESALDGQGNCSETRNDAAAALADYLATDPTGSGDDDVLILGDLNAYRMEDAITTLESAGYTDLAEAFVGPDAYSYVFDGQLGYLDYAMANASLLAQVTGATEWHINADEVPLLDYNDAVRDTGEASFERESDVLPIYAADPYRASDHDPVVVGLDLTASPTIPEIQGAGHTSPFAGDDVLDVAGIVTEVVGNGFYVQDPVGDGDDATSDAIFVFTGSTPAVAIGDDVLVDGTVGEFGFSGSLTTTQIGSATVDVVSSGNTLPTVTVIGSAGRTPPATVIDDDGLTTFDPTTDGIDFHESLESMLVEVADPVVVGPDRFGELTLLADGGAGVDQRTIVGGVHISPSDFNPERIVVDFDDIGPGAPPVAIGDTIDPPTGVMAYTFGNYKVLSRDTPAVTDGGTTPETTTVIGSRNQLTVATYNVLNLDPGDGARFDELATDIVGNLQAPDIVALQEIQDNNGPVDDGTVDADITLQMLADAIATAGGPTYDYLTIAPEDKADGGQPGANIQVAFLYDASRVGISPNPGDATTGTSVDANGDLVLNPGRVDPTNTAWDVPEGTRRPIAAQFEFNGHDVVVINNHLKSKSQDDALYGSTQPPVEHTAAQRQAQAQVVNDFVDEILAADADANVIVLGDMNDFAFSAPLTALAGDALTNLVADVDPADRWSFVFDGNSQTLDHILVSDNLVAGASPVLDIVHVNAAFDPSLRASDHDPVLVGLTLRRAGSGGPGGGPTEPPTEEPTEPPTGDRSIREQCDDDATCTSVTVSQQTFVDGARSLFQQVVPAAVATEALLASDTVFADALASGALQDTRPLLLNDPDALEDEVLAEIQRLGVGAVWILGGVDAVGQDVEDALVAEGLDVRRIAGPTRLETAQAVAELVGTAQPLLARAFPGDGDATQAFADSLAAGGWAAGGDRSVLLSQTEVLSDSTAAHLEASIASEATLVGGPAALADAVLNAVRDLGFTSDRVAGANRFDTAARIATERGFGDDRRADVVIISEGQADDAWEGGFTAAAPAAVFDAPILLANGDDLPPETLAALADMVEADAEVMCLASSAACEAAVEAIG